MSRRFRSIIFFTIFGLIIVIAAIAYTKIYPKVADIINRWEIEKINKETLEEATVPPSQSESEPESTSPSTKIISESPEMPTSPQPNSILEIIIPPPSTAYLNVPFITQAPLQTEENWKLHEESCEEAATLQAYLYKTNQTMTKEEANIEILNMIAWQEKPENFGEHRDLYANDMKKFITGYYQLAQEEVKIIYDADIEDIKKLITSGHPVIVPITGDILNNPYYPYPGYHMLTVIGYTEDRIITNDNGTRRGKDFSYDTKIFETAMKDAGGDILIFSLAN